MNHYENDLYKNKEKGQFDEMIDKIKQNEYYQKINNHEITGKIKEATQKIVDKSKKAITKGEENMKKEDEKRKDGGGVVLI